MKQFKQIKPLYLIIAALFGLTLIGAVIAVLLSNNSNDGSNLSNTTENSSAINWLKPDKTIKIVDNRYVSNCSVLPKKNVEDIWGSLPATGNITENYTENSISFEESSLDSSRASTCTYNYGKDGAEVELYALQYYKNKSANYLPIHTSQDPDSSEAQLSKLALAAKREGDGFAKDLVARFEPSLRSYAESEKDNYSGKLPLDAFNGTTLPVNSDISRGEFSFYYKHNNVIFKITYIPAESAKQESFEAYSDVQIAEAMSKIEQSIVVMADNLKNSKLDQSPAPTIIGSSDTYGASKLLEVCSLNDSKSFEALYGIADNEKVSREGLPVSVDASSDSSSTDISNFAASSCRRENENKAYDSRAISLNLLTVKSASDAEAYANKEFASGSVGQKLTTLQTDADWAALYQPTQDGPIAVYFRVGPYVMEMLTSVNAGRNSQASYPSQDAYVSAVNAIVNNLKRDLETASQQ
jgi:hypothetical protein